MCRGDRFRAMPRAMPRATGCFPDLGLMSTPRFVEQESLDACTGSPFCKPLRHNIRDVKGKLVRNQTMSPEFILKYIEWRKSRVAMLAPTRKRDRGWYESVTGIWSQGIWKASLKMITFCRCVRWLIFMMPSMIDHQKVVLAKPCPRVQQWRHSNMISNFKN